MRLSLGFDSLAVVPQVSLGHAKVSSEEILHGEESVDVTGRVSKDTYRTTVGSRVPGARPSIGHAVLQGERVTSVILSGKKVYYDVRRTNRGKGVMVRVGDGGEHTRSRDLVLTWCIGPARGRLVLFLWRRGLPGFGDSSSGGRQASASTAVRLRRAFMQVTYAYRRICLL